MKTIIAGSRGIYSYEVVTKAIEESGFEISQVVSGGAKGVDLLGERYAKEKGISIVRFDPDWSIGRQAGMLRNISMGNYAEALIAIWDGESRGTRQMIEYAKKVNLKLHIVKFDN